MDGSGRSLVEAQGGGEAAWFEGDPSARVIVTADFAVVRANRLARQMLADLPQPGWRLEQGRLRPPPTYDDRLRALIGAAVVDGDASAILANLLVRGRRLDGTDSLVCLTLRNISGVTPLAAADLEPIFGITRAEQQTVVLMLQGYSATEIAARLNKSVLTVRTHLKHVHTKLNVSTKEQLFARLARFLFID